STISLTPASSPAVPPSIHSFTISPLPSGSARVRWATSNATEVLLDLQLVANSGQATISLTTGRTLHLTAINIAGTISRALILQPPQTQATGKAVVMARYVPKVRQFTLGLTPRGDSALLVWRVTSARQVTLNGRIVSQSGRQAEPVGPDTYRLRAANQYGDVTATLLVVGGPNGHTVRTTPVALAPPNITEFVAAPTARTSAMELHWRTKGTHLVLLNGKRVGLSGRLTIGMRHPTQVVTLLASNGFLRREAQLRVSYAGGATTTKQFSIALPVIKSFVLTRDATGKLVSWHIVGALKARLGGRVVSLKGHLPPPPGSTVLLLEATNDAGTTRAYVTVSGPTITPTKTPAAIATSTPRSTPTPIVVRVRVPSHGPKRTHTATRTPTATPTVARHRVLRANPFTPTPSPSRARKATASATPRRRLAGHPRPSATP